MRDSNWVKARTAALGFDLVGITPAEPIPQAHAFYTKWIQGGNHAEMGYLAEHVDLKKDPRHLLPSAKSVIVVGLNYNQPNPESPGQPKIARYALGRDYHKVLRSKLKKLALHISKEFPDAEHRICVDSAPILDRAYANMAGLGWFGKNTMLINSQKGSWFVIGILLTNVEFQPDKPAVGGCGTCTRCIDACPTGAIQMMNGRWAIRSGQCISYLTIEHKGEIPTELGEKFEGWTFGCDICQEVCPFNQPRSTQPLRAALTTEPDFLATRPWPSLVELAEFNHEKWDSLTQGSPVRRAGLEGLQRNAKVSTKNA